MAGKLCRKRDNTLGLFLSVNGFSEDGVKAHPYGRRMMLLMNARDLSLASGHFQVGMVCLCGGRPTRLNKFWKRGSSRKSSMLGSIW